jgi:BirA family biotin operon repressor/biotin-[acetyl-CoA-carboxylase] ligase
MAEENDGFSESEILSLTGAGGSPPLQVTVLPETDSTNDEAQRRARQGAPEGTVIFAEKQTSGRGRLNRRWESPEKKNIYASILLRPALLPSITPQITLIAGIACYEALEPFLKPAQGSSFLRLKWPNDLWVHAKKIGGILTEMETHNDSVDFIVVGIGLNVNAGPEDFSEALRPIATSLRIETGSFQSRSAIVADLLLSFFRIYRSFLKNGFEALRKKWESYSRMQGRKVKVQENQRSYEGVCEGLDENGFLLVRTPAGVEKVIAGDVMWV